jgi:hypothetical protein
MTSSLAELTERHELHKHEITRKRLQLLKSAENNPEVRKYIKARCEEDITFFADMFVVAFNPRVRPSTIPFICFPKQLEFLNWAKDLKESSYHDKTQNYWGVCVKSRYTGASVLCCILLIHAWLFDKDFTGAVGSRKAELIYNAGNPDALFSKLTDMVSKLPGWMTPNWIVKRNLLTNLDNSNTIKGEAGSNIGRGGRSSLYILDEAAFIEQSNKVIASLSENTDCVIMISTPNGCSNYFAKAYQGGEYPTFQITWRDDPRRSEEWYAKQVARFDSFTVAQELDCDFYASIEGVIIESKWIQSAVNNQNKLDVESLKGNRNIIAGFDPAGEGKDRNALVIRHGIEVIGIYDWVGLDTTQSAEKVIQICLENKVNKLIFDVGGVGSDLAGTLKQRKRTKEWADRLFTFEAVQFGQAPSEHYWDIIDMSSKDRFTNAATEMVWLVRERFKRTYEVIQGLRDWDISDLICLPNHNELLGQLTVYTADTRPNGKIQRISKKDLREAGIKSPDFFDALCLAFYTPQIYNVGDLW